MDLTVAKQELFAKWWGVNDILDNDAFWDSVLEFYSIQEEDAPLPLQMNPETYRRVSEMLDCPKGCTDCCFYPKVQVNRLDRVRILKKTSVSEGTLDSLISRNDEGITYFNCKDGCKFLCSEGCTIYDARPDACYMFPFGQKSSKLNNMIVQQMIIRIRCRPALDVARTLIIESMATGNKILLPDLTLIQKGGGK